MGLDQYAYQTKDDRAVGAFKIPHEKDGAAFAYGDIIKQWRKHPDLHGWMRELYRQKGGAGVPEIENGDTLLEEEFNAGEGVELTAADLDALEGAIKLARLPKTKGFFFGESWLAEERDGDLTFITKAREAIRQGFRVYYTSWW